MPGVQLRVEPNGFGIALHDQSDSLLQSHPPAFCRAGYIARPCVQAAAQTEPTFELAAGLQGVWLRDEQSGIEVERTWFGPN